MTNPHLEKILDSVRAAGLSVARELNPDKTLTLMVLVQGEGTFTFELTPTQAMELARHLATPIIEATARGDLP